MPERARLVDREQEDALRRAARADGADPASPALTNAAHVGHVRHAQGSGPSSLGVARAMGPATVMAMQRLAGNRATVQTLARTPRRGQSDRLGSAEDEQAVEGGGGSGQASAMSSQADMAVGTPSGGASGGGASQGAGDGSSGKAGEIAAASAGGSIGSNASGKAGEIAAGAKSRKTPPPPIVLGGAAGGSAGAAGNKISLDGGPGSGGSAAGGAAGNKISLDGGPAPSSGTAPVPAAVPARAPTAPTGPGGLPAPEAASTGIDWAKLLADYGPPARTVLELTRIIPGWGLLGGLASDSINFASDIEAIPNSENADLATGLIVFRNIVNIGNNGLGHILYVNQLIQDGLAGSVVGAEFTPLTAAANEALSTVKVVLDEVQMGTDIIVEVEALYESNHAPTSAEADQWKSLADGYAANILGDVVNLVLDVISLSSAGAANTAPIQQGRQPLTLAAAFMKNATPNIISAVNGVLGVWLGSLVTEGRQAFVGSPTDLRAQAVVLDGAGSLVEAEGTQARATYDGINAVIDGLAAYAGQQVAQINAVAEALSGGKSAFELIRDAVAGSLTDMTRKLDMVQELGVAASDGQANAAAIAEACASVLGALDEMVLPSVTLPSVDIGEGIVADAAEAVANEAAEAANAAITEAMSGVSEALETAKSSVREPVEAAQAQAGNLGEWLAILATQCATMAGTLSGQISTFSEGLGRCTNIEQVIDLIIGQVSDLTGMPRVTVQEIRDAWNSVGPYIDQFIDLGARMHTRASDLRGHADLVESGGGADTTTAPPPEPPPNPNANPKPNPAGGAAAPAKGAAA